MEEIKPAGGMTNVVSEAASRALCFKIKNQNDIVDKKGCCIFEFTFVHVLPDLIIHSSQISQDS